MFLVLNVAPWPAPAQTTPHAVVDFTRDIRPILSNHCFQCHGPDAAHREADLRFDLPTSREAAAALEGREDSEFLARIEDTDPDVQMPPAAARKPLDAKQQELLRRWVLAGAKSDGHWAYQTPRATAPPAATAWTRNWIDQFIAARHRREGLEPSEDADAVTLVRRLHFDLLGLPPEPQDVEAFLKDPSEQALHALVDRLLASEHFGERMAAYWLDLVRYADTVGYHGDQDHNISPYRDYVIDAFNRNLAFDQFTREQLAGDLLENPTVDQRIATGYNRMLQTSHEGGVQPKEYLAIYQADRVRNVSGVWLGGTLGCAQCHDHKYDPYTSADFYSMAAFFADVDEEGHFKRGTNALPTARPPEIDVLSRTDREALARITAQLTEQQASGASEAARAALVQAKKQIEARKRRTMVTVALKQPRTVRLLPRGNWLDDSGPVMQPAVPAFLGTLPEGARRTRLDLAHWLTDAEQGVGLLTARVFVNRYWSLLFGQGLSESVDDFGGQGKPPNHPELLDQLAIRYVESGWDTKALLKSMVTSRTYRQSSRIQPDLQQRDPLNRFFARQSRFRLPAEFVRDMALASSGLLVREVGGPSVKPYQPFGYYRHLNFPQRRYAHHADARQWRRGVYVHWQRQYLHPMLRAFDAPSREECTAVRPQSNTPLAALVLLNDPTFVEAARALAVKMCAAGTAPQARLEFGVRQVLSREPTPTDVQALLALQESVRQDFASDAQARQLLGVGESVEEVDDAVDVAAWTFVARALLNLAEATTRQ